MSSTAQLPPSLIPRPTPNATPVASAAPASLDHDVELGNIPTGNSLSTHTLGGTEPEATMDGRDRHDCVQRYHTAMPPPLPHTTS